MPMKFISLPFWRKLLMLLRVRPAVGGLEVNDAALRFVEHNGTGWRAVELRLPPGIIAQGTVQDHAQFVAALRSLAEKIRAGHHRALPNIVVALSSASMYTQVFSLPSIERPEELTKAIKLNMQMVSPIDLPQAYAGWQVVHADAETSRLEILGAFINRSVVDDIRGALREVGFMVHAIEPEAMSLARVIWELGAGIDQESPYLVLTFGNMGLDILVLRHGQLYFQYFTSWKTLFGDRRQIQLSELEEAIVRNLRQVLNFYNVHWSELVTGIFVFAGDLRDSIVRIVQGNFSLRILDLQLKTPLSLSPNWYVALGTGLRSLMPYRQDTDLSLLGLSAQEEFRREQVRYFLGFWRVLVPVVLGVMLAVPVGADFWLRYIGDNLKENTLFALGGEQAATVAALNTKIAGFNRAVTFLEKVDKGTVPKSPLFDAVSSVLRKYGISLVRFSLQSPQLAATLTGSAPSEDQIIQFKKELEGDPRFRDVNLSLTDIKSQGNAWSFSISFTMVPPSAS
jgi:hypothetical protein